MPSRPLTPERAADVHVYTPARRHHWENPQGEDRARTIGELEETAAPFPHLLAEHAGIFLGAARNASETEARRYLIAAQLLIEAGADLGDVERSTVEGEYRTLPRIMRAYGYEDAQRYERERGTGCAEVTRNEDRHRANLDDAYGRCQSTSGEGSATGSFMPNPGCFSPIPTIRTQEPPRPS